MSSLDFDLMGRLTQQTDYSKVKGSSFVGANYSRALAYNAKGQVVTDEVSTVRGRYGNNLYDTYKSMTSYGYGSGAGYALGRPAAR